MSFNNSRRNSHILCSSAKAKMWMKKTKKILLGYRTNERGGRGKRERRPSGDRPAGRNRGERKCAWRERKREDETSRERLDRRERRHANRCDCGGIILRRTRI